MRCSPRLQFSLFLLAACLLCLRSLSMVAHRSTQQQGSLASESPDPASPTASLAERLQQDEAPRVQAQCGGATWQQEYAALHSEIRSGRAPPGKRGRFLTFTCIPGACGGIGDLFIGLVSAFIVALMQDRALIVDYQYMEQAFEPASPM